MIKENISSENLQIIQSEIAFYGIIAGAIITGLFLLIQIIINYFSSKKLEKIKIDLIKISEKDKKNLEYIEKLKQKKIDNYNQFILGVIDYLSILDNSSESAEKLNLLRKNYGNLILTSPENIIGLSTNFLLSVSDIKNKKDDIRNLFEKIVIEMYVDIEGENKIIKDKDNFKNMLDVFYEIQETKVEVLYRNRHENLLEQKIIGILKENKNILKIIQEPYMKIDFGRGTGSYRPDLLLELSNNEKIGVEIKSKYFSERFKERLDILNSKDVLDRYGLKKFILLTEEDDIKTINSKL